MATTVQIARLRIAQKKASDLIDYLYGLREREGEVILPLAVLARAKDTLALLDSQMAILGIESRLPRFRDG